MLEFGKQIAVGRVLGPHQIWCNPALNPLTDADSRVTTTQYDALDRVSTVTDPVSRATHFVYDAAGQTLTEIRAYGSALQENYASYTYSDNGKQQSVKDANTNETDFAYDGFDRLATTTFPDGTTEQIPASGGYDANGNVLKRINRSNQMLTFTYDNLDRMTAKVSPSPALTVTWAYLANGLVDKICDATNCGASGNVIDYGYDTAGRLSSAATTLAGLSGAKTISYTLDANGNRTNLLWPDGYSVTYAYDSLNRMATAVNGATTLASYTYNPLSQRTNLAYNNSTGATVAYTWTTAGDLLTLAHNFLGTTNDVTYTETYTNAHQLATETISDTDYRFAPGANGTVAYASANNLNQYPSVGGQTLSYDTRGNLTGDGTWTYSYDAENRLTCANKTGTNATFTYDPLGRRVLKATGGSNCSVGTSKTYYLSDGSNEIAEYTGAGAGTLQYRYVPGPAIDDPIAMVKVTAPAATTYFHENKTGSVVAMSGSTSALTEGPYTYDAYGTVSASTGVAYKFTGRRLDPETGLYYYRARYYDPVRGRFPQADPVGYSAGMNLYAYVGNDPTDKIDPKGNCPSCIGALVGGGLELGLQLLTPEGRAAYVAAARAIANHDFQGAVRAAGAEVAKVALSAAAGAAGVGIAGKVAEIASIASKAADVGGVGKILVNATVNATGNAAAGAGLGAAAQIGGNAAAIATGAAAPGQTLTSGAGAAAIGGGVGGALGSLTTGAVAGETQNLATATGNFVGGRAGVAIPNVVSSSAERAGAIVGPPVAKLITSCVVPSSQSGTTTCN